MDPKQNPQLDPKLQEAYDRVMGITISGDPTNAPSPSLKPDPAPDLSQLTPTPTPSDTTPSPMTANPPAPHDTASTAPTPLPAPDASVDTSTISAPPSTPVVTKTPNPTMDSTAATMPLATPVVMPHSQETVHVGALKPEEVIKPATHGFVAKSGKKGISPVVIGLGVIVFLLAYTLFWVKFFNVPVPFLNQ